eukprot:gene2928-3214_t
MQPFQRQCVLRILLFVLICLHGQRSVALKPFKSTILRSTESYTAAAEADRVLDLPGSPAELDFALFAGYVTVSEVAGRALYYVFAEARSRARHAPLLLWLNGGPGCSSLGGGLMSELGPFYPTKDGKSLIQNPWSWNNIANVIFLESPAFVGFSYSNTSSDAIVGDARTAFDARQFLLGWLEKFPQFKHRDFYIAGESYGGHYVPNLALEIYKGNKRAAATGAAAGQSSIPGVREGHINLQGFLGGPEFSHQDSKEIICAKWLDIATYELGNINIYEIYAGDVNDVSAGNIFEICPAAIGDNNDDVPRFGHPHRRPRYDPCIDGEVEVYMNLPEVQEALHANQSVKLPWRWTDCTPLISYSREDLLSSMIPVYKQLLQTGMKIWVFSGDVDGIVPVLGSRRWVASLDLPLAAPWRPWTSSTGQVI